MIESGGNSRSTGSTGVNADSSRSHAILQLDLKHQQDGESIGRFSFVDLAGSERAADVTDSDKQTRMEGAEINQSLLAVRISFEFVEELYNLFVCQSVGRSICLFICLFKIRVVFIYCRIVIIY